MTIGKRKAAPGHSQWKLLGFAFLLAMGSCLVYMTVVVPKFLFIFDGSSAIDDSYKNEHLVYQKRQRNSRVVENYGDVYKWWDASVNPLLRKSSQGTSFIIKQPKQALKQWKGDVFQLKQVVRDARAEGRKVWKEVVKLQNDPSALEAQKRKFECPLERSLNKQQLENAGRLMVLPCGLQTGSSVSIVGKPQGGHVDHSNFVVELQALKSGRTEDPPRVLHVNPRLSGDWSGKQVIEVNSCFHGKWGRPQRCGGASSSDDDTVDGLCQCEEWLHEDRNGTQKDEESFSWLKSLFGKKPTDQLWQFPLAEDSFFVLTIRAGWEGYHINIDGRHILSFPYRKDFSLEDATGLYVGGYVDAHMALATALPLSNLSVPIADTLELSEYWRPPPLPSATFELFIGISSTSSHFAERMAARKSWMQSLSILHGRVVARFFVALCADNLVNVQLKQEADFYGDIIIVPFIERYELVVLKTIAICEYGIRNVSATFIMKCDDDTFANVESILSELETTPYKEGLYMGNINKYHRPQRSGKWAVSYKEWPEDEYPLYADGPGYVVSSDIARFIVAHNAKNTLRMFKMEDVSMGLWVSQFALSLNPVLYIHHSKFCQWGCVEDYYTAHYMSPRQMLCMWEKLSAGRAKCCNL